jgi:ATP-dependent Clp protease adaptor protein ClpS
MSTQFETKTSEKVKHMPLWHVILHNTDFHTVEFVVKLIMTVFKHDFEKAKLLTIKIHEEGACIVETTHKERAEMLQELVKGFGADPMMKGKKFPLPCTIEPVMA